MIRDAIKDVATEFYWRGFGFGLVVGWLAGLAAAALLALLTRRHRP